MMKSDSIKSKDRSFISSMKNIDYPGGQGDQDDDKYLVPGFDSETMDLDEAESSGDEVLEKAGADKSMCHRSQSTGDACTVIGTNSLGKKVAMLVFSVETVLHRGGAVSLIAVKNNISFKIYKTECKLVRTILASHGLRECISTNNDYNLLWTGCHVRPFTLRTMSEFQKINHFPRSYELTRKDRLFKNVQRMQQLKGMKNFDFLPASYLIPSEFQDLCHNFGKDKGPFIVKPVALSRGRGIFLCNHPNQIPLDEQLIVSKYISNPYLIDGLKFDIRMYVLVTSYDPLVVYLYEEGLTRFATVKYHSGLKNLKTQCMHLTNYSVNKKNDNFVQNDDADIEDFGNKWSLGALLRHLKSKDVDTTCLMMKIEDIIIKSLISVESQISSSCRMFQPYRGNCFEVYGYDIIIDEGLRPWLLEVNLSPSLSCDSPLDFKIKSHMLSDMFNVVGVACQDPLGKSNIQAYNNTRTSSVRRSSPISKNKIPNPTSSYNSSIRRPTAGLKRREVSSNGSSYKSEELRLVRRVKEEAKRCGGWVRIFPTVESINTYFPFFQNCSMEQSNMNALTTYQLNLNLFLHSKLYPDSNNDLSNSRISMNNSGIRSRLSLHNVNYNAAFHKVALSQLLPSGQSHFDKISSNYTATQTRVPFYERKLGEEISRKSDPDDRNTIYRKEVKRFVKESDTDNSSTNSSTSVSDKEDYANNSDLESETEEDDDDEDYDNNQRSTSPSSKETISLQKLIDSGGKLTKIQARLAFSNYLARVQYRLLLESRTEPTRGSSSSEEENCRHEQLELVLRFLRRAASNMSSEEFAISAVPARSQSLSYRQEWLAKLLGEFIRIYSRETKLAEGRQGKDCETEIDNRAFLNFLRLASENDLEKTLSNYTKVNKSAGIFLQPSVAPKPSPQKLSECAASPVTSSLADYPAVGFHKSVSMTNLSTKESPDQNNSNNNNRCPRAPSRQSLGKPQQQQAPNVPASPAPSHHHRPSSAQNIDRPRPITAAPSTTPSHGSRDRLYDPTAISKALQRLAADHRSRQLTASTSTLCDSDYADYDCPPSSLRHATDPLTRSLLRQHRQSRILLQESRAKHDAILSRTAQFADKPPPGVRIARQTRLSCTMKK